PLSAPRSLLAVDRGPLSASRSPLSASRGPLSVERGPLAADRSPHSADRGSLSVARGRLTVTIRRCSPAFGRRSVLIWIVLVRAGHDHNERPQRMQHLDRGPLRLEHVRQTAIDVRAFVRAAATHHDALPLHPLVHHLARDRARLQYLP